MKISTFLLTLCFTSSLAIAQDAAQPKRNLLSIFRSKKAPAEAASQLQVPAPQQQDQAAHAPGPVAQPKRGLRLPQFRKPDFSKMRLPKMNVPKVRMPQVNMPKFSMPKVGVPKWNMPKVSLPKFKRLGGGDFAQGSDVMKDYPGAIPTNDGTGFYAIVKDKNVKFYELGPSQPYGPDDYLSPGDRITLMSNDRSWAHVTLKDGRSGYVGLDQVRFASQGEVPRQRMSDDRLVQSAAQPTELEPLEGYMPPSLPSVPTAESPEAQFNPLLDPLNPEASEPVFDVSGPSEVLIDPSIDPLPSIGGGPAPFLEDPLLGTGVPSIEDELRAIEALPADVPTLDPEPVADDPDSGESAEES